VKNKKWILLLIIAFPSLFWLILETSTIHSKKLPYYGPKTVKSPGDTIYHSVSDKFYAVHDSTTIEEAPDATLYAISFISEKYRDDAYRLTGLWEYLNYKKSKVEHIPVVLVTATTPGGSMAFEELKELAAHRNVRFYTLPPAEFKSKLAAYFLEKPYYTDYSYFVLVDMNRNIRGYYDMRYVSEMKRLIAEYQHLRLKEEKQKLTEANEIKSN
jgi:hypothetical protein